MRNSLKNASIAFLMTFTLISSLPAQAGGCGSHKKAEIECESTDEECIQKKAEKKLSNFDV